jgi:hypothetical protein
MPAQHRRRTGKTGRTRRRKNRNLFSRKRNNISYRLNYSLKRGGIIRKVYEEDKTRPAAWRPKEGPGRKSEGTATVKAMMAAEAEAATAAEARKPACEKRAAAAAARAAAA